MKSEHSLTIYTKINSKWIKDLNIRSNTVILLEEKQGKYSDINQSKIFFDPPPRVMKIKINKWDLIKCIIFCTAKETITKIKRQPSEWEKIFANEAIDKALITRILEQLIQLNNNQPTQKWLQDLNRHLSREDIQMATRHMKRCSTSQLLKN